MPSDTRYRSTPLDLAAGYGSVDVVSYLVHDKNCYDPAIYEGFNKQLYTLLHTEETCL